MLPPDSARAGSQPASASPRLSVTDSRSIEPNQPGRTRRSQPDIQFEFELLLQSEPSCQHFPKSLILRHSHNAWREIGIPQQIRKNTGRNALPPCCGCFCAFRDDLAFLPIVLRKVVAGIGDAGRPGGCSRPARGNACRHGPGAKPIHLPKAPRRAKNEKLAKDTFASSR